MLLENPHSKGLVHILWHHQYVMGTFGGSRVCLKEAEPWRYAIKDNDENLAFLLCIFNCYKYYLLLLLCNSCVSMVFVCDVWTFILPTTYGWRSEDKFMVSVLSLHICMGSRTELKLSGFAWTLLDTKSSHWSSSLTSLFPSWQERHRILWHMFFAMMWWPMTSQKPQSQSTTGSNFQNDDAKFHNLTISNISLPCKKMFNTYVSTFGEEGSNVTF